MLKHVPGDCPITKDIDRPFTVFEGSERGESEVALEFGKVETRLTGYKR